MKCKNFIIGMAFICIVAVFMLFSNKGLEGALNGIWISYNVIIPSLLPLTVFSLIIFESNILKICKSNRFSIYVMSFIGGFPVGAKIIEKSYINGDITKRNAELMLCYCVNSTPSFIVISVGLGILSDIRFGYIYLIANLISGMILFLIMSLFYENEVTERRTVSYKSFSEIFVNSTYEATNSMINVCGFVVLFSSINAILSSLINNNAIKNISLIFLEITNGIILADKNIYLIAFLLGFAGFSVHFQVLSICKNLKPNYTLFLLFRIIHGILMMIISKIIIRFFGISLSTVLLSSNNIYEFSQISAVFGVLFIVLSIMFIISVSIENNKM